MRILILIALATLAINKKKLSITSFAFENNGRIPERYTCDGKNVNPELLIKGIPDGTKSLVLIVDDPDASEETFDHWIMWNIPAGGKLSENSASGIQGNNSSGENKYTGPCPPTGLHHYHFKLYAIDILLDLKEGSGKKQVMKAMEGHLLERAELIGLYER
ncbi:MAG: hypothetical protein K0S33_781 [Bacteroidetes bacterium]|jgi:Raf kinase inhibitor-like YbhB/YbcL family protein|nr:hypothetical protein [Bacteroidota bacterium]